jgi:hypothetical protein
MKNSLGLLFLLFTGAFVACSSDDGKSDGSFARGGASNGSSGGSSVASGSTGSTASGSSTVIPVEAGAVIPKDFSAAEDGGLPDGGYFGGTLRPYGDPNDPCSTASIWISGIELAIKNGDFVQYEGKVYKYDTSTSSCNEKITYTFDACLPSAPAEWCKPCWILQTGIECPIIDITVIPDVVESDAGTTASG